MLISGDIVHKLSILALISLTATSSFADDWPQFRGPHNDGLVQLQTPIDKLAITQVWQVPLGDAFSAISVSAGKAVTMAQRDNDEFLIILDAVTGKEFKALRIDKTIKDGNGNGPRSTPAIDASRIYVYSSHMKLICFDISKDQPLWQHDICKEYNGKVPPYGNASSPILIDDLLLITGGGEGHAIMAFKKETGELAWASGDDPHTHVTPTPTTIAGQKQVICYLKSGLVSVDPKNGKILWTFARPSCNTGASPIVGGKDNNIVFASAAYGVGGAACKISRNTDQWTATPLWGTKGKHMIHWSTPIYHDGYIYGFFGPAGAKGSFECLDINTGQSKWSQPFDNRGGMILMGDKFLIQTPDGDLVLVAASPESYKELDRTPLFKGKNWIAPSFADGMLFARNNSEKNAQSQAVCLKLASH